MALSPEKISFFIRRIQTVEYPSFHSVVAQLFDYLVEQIKDNPIYNKFESDRERWHDWPNSEEGSFGRHWELPENLEDSKSLAYYIYKTLGENGSDNVRNFSFTLFRQRSININLNKLNEIFLPYLTQALDDIIKANPEIDSQATNNIEHHTVFIVHGHDVELKVEVQLLLGRAGVKSIVLHEQPDKGRTIIDKLIEETKSAGYAIALLTPDDLTQNGINRPRQNVILEIGYFLGRVGKERIRMIVKGNVEVPSDLQGILYEKHDEKGAWKIKLLKELQAVGINVNIQQAVSEF